MLEIGKDGWVKCWLNITDFIEREHNMVRFKDGVPVGIWYSQHAWGEACLWDDEACLSKQGDRVRVPLPLLPSLLTLRSQ